MPTVEELTFIGSFVTDALANTEITNQGWLKRIGLCYYDSTLSAMKYWDGSVWTIFASGGGSSAEGKGFIDYDGRAGSENYYDRTKYIAHSYYAGQSSGNPGTIAFTGTVPAIAERYLRTTPSVDSRAEMRPVTQSAILPTTKRFDILFICGFDLPSTRYIDIGYSNSSLPRGTNRIVIEYEPTAHSDTNWMCVVETPTTERREDSGVAFVADQVHKFCISMLFDSGNEEAKFYIDDVLVSTIDPSEVSSTWPSSMSSCRVSIDGTGSYVAFYQLPWFQAFEV